MPKISLSLPHPGKIVVEAGVAVKRDDTLAYYEEREIHQLNLTHALQLHPAKIYQTLVKRLGERVEAEEIIAVKKQVFRKKIVRSPVSGTLASYDETRGILVIEKKGNTKELLSPVKGQIAEVFDDKTIILEFPGVVFEAKECLSNIWGEIKVVGSLDLNVDIYQINASLSGKILLGFGWTAACLKKALALDCAVIGVEIEGRLDTLAKNNYLASEIPSVMIIDRNTFSEILKYNGRQAVFVSKERKLFIETTS